MIVEVKIPSPGESITEVVLSKWLVNDGDFVEKNNELAEVESDKATLPLISSESGKINLVSKEGETVSVGSTACTIDTEAKSDGKKKPEPVAENNKTIPQPEKEKKEVNEVENLKVAEKKEKDEEIKQPFTETKVRVTPLAKNLMEENGYTVDDIIKGLRKISVNDVKRVVESGSVNEPTMQREEQRKKITQLRKKLAQRLVAVKNETAMLTTFNEVDMSAVVSLRKKYQDSFKEKFGIKLGIMSLFVKAVTMALKQFPMVNSMIDGEDVINPSYVDICIAVQTGKGLMVPVIRNAEALNIAEIENQIAELAEKARTYKISIEEMTGGTFTITNGGVFGSMLSTPIINPPQSAILGMHNIVERPVAVNGKVEIRPVMYLALSYDHRLIDGAESVSFLVKVKELIENPTKMLLDGDPGKLLLGL